MIIDFHTHIFPDKIAGATISHLESVSGLKAATNGCLNGLLASMTEAGIDYSVVMPVVTAPKQFAGINSFAQSINEEYADRLISFGGIHPDSEDYKAQLLTLKDRGFRGIKLHPDYQGVLFNDIRYKRIVSLATELDMVVMVHAGIDIGLPEPVHCTSDMALEVYRDTQATKLVLAHLGGWKQWDRVEALLTGQEVYLDIAFTQPYIEESQFLRIIEKHGSSRILFATDSPWGGQREAVDWISKSKLTEEDKQKILWQNAAELLQLKS